MPERSNNGPSNEPGKPKFQLGKWIDAKRREILIGVMIGYALIVFIYLLIWHPDPFKYIVVLLGVAVAAVVPDLASKRSLRLRLGLLCVPAIAIASIQLYDDHNNDEKLANLSKQLQSLTYAKYKDDVRASEEKTREMIILDAHDTVGNDKNADHAFIEKAKRIATKVMALRNELLATMPGASKSLTEFPSDVGNQLKAMRSLRQSQGLASPRGPEMIDRIDVIIRLLEQQLSYEQAADFFHTQVQPIYDELEKTGDTAPASEYKKRLEQIIAKLAPLADQLKIAGLYNNVGTLAMASEHPEQALSYFYAGYIADPDHLPIYESLGYALWALNGDARSALKYADLGLKRLASNTLAMRVEDWPKFTQDMSTRLKIEYAYFSALELKNESVARTYVNEVIAAHPHDAEYEDALGFVLMRFAKDRNEIELARTHFLDAISNPKAERLTPRLATEHLEELNAFVNQMERN